MTHYTAHVTTITRSLYCEVVTATDTRGGEAPITVEVAWPTGEPLPQPGDVLDIDITKAAEQQPAAPSTFTVTPADAEGWTRLLAQTGETPADLLRYARKRAALRGLQAPATLRQIVPAGPVAIDCVRWLEEKKTGPTIGPTDAERIRALEDANERLRAQLDRYELVGQVIGWLPDQFGVATVRVDGDIGIHAPVYRRVQVAPGRDLLGRRPYLDEDQARAASDETP